MDFVNDKRIDHFNFTQNSLSLKFKMTLLNTTLPTRQRGCPHAVLIKMRRREAVLQTYL
jgi:hypothetical protein